MKAQILKIAGVKSEKEFYKKFPTEAAFMKKHGKELTKLKKAQVGTMIQEASEVENPEVIDGNLMLEGINEKVLKQFGPLKDRALELGVDSLTTENEKEDYRQELAALEEEKKDDGNFLSKLSAAGDLIGGISSMLGQGDPKGSVEVGELEMLPIGKKGAKFKPHMMYDPKTGKGYKANKLADHLRMEKKGYTHNKPKKAQGGYNFEYPDLGFEIPEQPQYGNPSGSGFLGKSFSRGSYNPDGSAMNFGQRVGDFVKNDLGPVLQTPMVKDIMMGISKIKGQKDALKDLRQMEAVTDVARMAALSKPEQVDREYVRPEDIENTGEEFFPIYGVGTNVLAKNGQTMNMFANPGYAPLNNTSQVKTFQSGGRCWPGYRAVPGKTPYSKGSCQKAQDGTFLGMGSSAWDSITGIGGDLAYGKKADRDAGSNIGGGIGRGIGTAFGGPIGGAIGDFIGSGIGDLLDRNDSRQKRVRKNIDKNISDITNMQIGPQIQANYASVMKKGGKLPGPNNDYGMIGAPGPQILKTFDGKNLNNMLQKASRMPDTLKEGGSVAGKGKVKTLWGGDVGAVAYNPYAGGDSMYFDGNSHEKKDVKTGETGIGVAYGPQSVSMNEPVVEVEGGEPAQILNENGEENLVIYGDLKIPKGTGGEIGDPDADGKKFKHYVNNLNDEEARINKQMGKAVENAGDTDNTKWGELARSTSDAIINGGDMKLQDIANKKMLLADLQEALNDTFKEKGIDGNTFITKGEIKAVKDTEDYAKNGGKMETYTDYAEDGTKVKKLRKIEKELHKASKMHKSQAERIGKMVKAEDGAEIPKAQDSLRVNELGGGDIPKTDKTVEELLEEGYVQSEDNENVYVKITGEKVEAVEASSEALDEVPEGQARDEDTGLFGSVTIEKFNEAKEANPWFDWDNFDPKSEADVKRYQREFNKKAEEAGSDVRIQVDGDFGEQTASARFNPAVEAQDPVEERVEVEDVVTTDPTTTLPLRTPFNADLLNRLLRGDIDNELDYNQILPEINAAANNQVAPVYAQSFQPSLRVPYDISLQDRRNQITGAYRAMSQNPAVQNNPALAAAMAAPMYDAINNVGAEEFRLNQALKDTVYSGNLDRIDQAKMLNMGIYDKQQERQAQAVANTKETQQEIVKSIADKYQQNKLENRREKVLRELFPNFRFGDDLDLFNQGSATFNIPGYGQVGTGNPYLDLFGVLTGGGINPNANNSEKLEALPQNQIDRRMRRFNNIDARNLYDYVDPYDNTEVAYGKHGSNLKPIKKKVKRNQKNSNVLRMFNKQ